MDLTENRAWILILTFRFLFSPLLSQKGNPTPKRLQKGRSIVITLDPRYFTALQGTVTAGPSPTPARPSPTPEPAWPTPSPALTDPRPGLTSCRRAGTRPRARPRWPWLRAVPGPLPSQPRAPGRAAAAFARRGERWEGSGEGPTKAKARSCGGRSGVPLSDPPAW